MKGAARLERWLVVLVALHSFAVGIALLFLPGWSLRLGGWPEAGPLFFVRQGGAFHLVVAVGYLIEHFQCGGVRLLLTAKLTATVFLLGVAWLEPSSWVVPLSAVADALMGLVVLVAHRRVGSTE